MYVAHAIKNKMCGDGTCKACRGVDRRTTIVYHGKRIDTSIRAVRKNKSVEVKESEWIGGSERTVVAREVYREGDEIVVNKIKCTQTRIKDDTPQLKSKLSVLVTEIADIRKRISDMDCHLEIFAPQKRRKEELEIALNGYWNIPFKDVKSDQLKMALELEQIREELDPVWKLETEKKRLSGVLADMLCEESVINTQIVSIEDHLKHVSGGVNIKDIPTIENDEYGQFVIIPNNGAGRNACMILAIADSLGEDTKSEEFNRRLALVKKDNEMMETGKQYDMDMVRAFFKEGVNVRFFGRDIHNPCKMNPAGGNPHGGFKNVAYVLHTGNNHYVGLKPYDIAKAIKAVPKRERDYIKNFCGEILKNHTKTTHEYIKSLHM